MIKLSELRLENLVMDEDGNIRKVKAIISNDPCDKLLFMYAGSVILDDGLFQNELYLKPIKLTQEILNKHGFELFNRSVGNSFKVFINGFQFLVQYVHELQNIYYMMHKAEMDLFIDDGTK